MWPSQIQPATFPGNYSRYQKDFIQPLGKGLYYIPQSILGITRISLIFTFIRLTVTIPIPILRQLPPPNLLTNHKPSTLDPRSKLPLITLNIHQQRPTNSPIRHLRTLRNAHNNTHHTTLTRLGRILQLDRRLFPSLLQPLTEL